MKILVNVFIGIFCIGLGWVLGQLIAKAFMYAIVALVGEKAVIDFFNMITI
jgi:hypothetical protein